MTRDREYARANCYDCYCFHLLCRAAQRQARLVQEGYDCFIFTETYSQWKQTVYYLAHKRLNQLTRAQRGCNIERTTGLQDSVALECAFRQSIRTIKD